MAKKSKVQLGLEQAHRYENAAGEIIGRMLVKRQCGKNSLENAIKFLDLANAELYKILSDSNPQN